MAKQPDHKKEFSADDLRRYHTGQMSPGERHTLEKAALEDPFLADALDGYAFTDTHEKDLSAIRVTLSGKTGRKKSLPLFFKGSSLVKAAAVVLVLAGAGWFVSTWNDAPRDLASGNSNVQLSRKVEVVQPPSSNAAAADTLHNLDKTGVKTENAITGMQQGDEPAIARGTTKNAPIPAKQKDLPAAFQQESDKDAVVVAGYTKLNEVMYRNDSVLAARAETAPAEARVRSATPGVTIARGPTRDQANYFKGRVVDANFNALPYATVVTDKKEAIQTDVHGNFTLESRDSVLQATVTALGYEPNRLQLNTSNQNTVVLKQNQANMDEVVVVSTAKVGRTERQYVVIDTLEPAGGWRRFDDYIAQNIKLPEAVERKDVSGEVRLSFEINSKGEPVNITVEKSLCAKCDEEAIRLLKAGPKWKKKKDQRGKLTIRF
jgi:hypothetical protein